MASKLLIFPWKLHALLNNVERNNQTDIISWTPGGKSFKVHDKERFCNEIMPDFFAGQSGQFKTFQRSLNLWGFKSVDSSSLSGTTRGGKSIEYSHACFVQGNPDMCLAMKRVRVRGIRNRPYLRSPVASGKKKTKANTKSSGTKKSPPNVMKESKPVADDDSSATNNSENVGTGVGADSAGDTTTTSASTTIGEHHLTSRISSIAERFCSQQGSGSSNPLVDIMLQRLLVPPVTPPQQEYRQDSSYNLELAIQPNNVLVLAGLLGGHYRDQQVGPPASGTTTTDSFHPVRSAVSTILQQSALQQQQQYREPPRILPSSPPIANQLLGVLGNNQIDQLLQIINNENVIRPLPRQREANIPFASLFSTVTSTSNNVARPHCIVNLLLAQLSAMNR